MRPPNGQAVPDFHAVAFFVEQGQGLLIEALGLAQRVDVARAQAQAYLRDNAALPEQVRIVRPLSPSRAELILLDMTAMLDGRTLDFPLEPGDVVFVPDSPISAWNAALDRILVSLEFIGGVVAPITLIRTLQDT